ncbi:MAG: hypothetical protein ACREQJ_13745 [Candidatus Binatia bacterium]
MRQHSCGDRSATPTPATPGERVRRHRRIGETIEELHRGTLDAHAAELAHHFAEVAAGGEAGKALVYAMRAGERTNPRSPTSS